MHSEESLRLVMDYAFQRFRDAFEQLRTAKDLPMGPGEDGALLIKQAGARCESALADYMTALKNYNEFVKNGF